MDIELLLDKLDQCSRLETNEDIAGFLEALHELAPVGNPLAIQQALNYFDDEKTAVTALFTLVCFCESFKPELYLDQLIKVFPEFMTRAPVWLWVIHQRLLKESKFFAVYKHKLRFVRDQRRDAIYQFLREMSGLHPAFKHYCHGLLYAMDKAKWSRSGLDSPLKSDYLLKGVEKACVESHLSMHLNYYNNKDRLCGAGLILDPDTLDITPALNSDSHFLATCEHRDAKEARWLPEYWACHKAKQDFFSDIGEILRLRRQYHIRHSMTAEEFLFWVLELLITTFETLAARRFFYRKCVLVIRIKGQSVSARDIEWVKRLNTKENASEFSEWVYSLVRPE